MEPLSQVVAEITRALDSVSVPYAIGGSVASGTRGVWRSTLDVDIVAAIQPTHVEPLVHALGSQWFADPEMIRDLISGGRSFNVIHKGLAHKVDIFPAAEDFHFSQLERATRLPLGDTQVGCNVLSAEDILLAKLRWYREGGETSETQWNDIVGVTTTTPSIDEAYLRRWAARLHVTDLLEKALASAGS